MDTAHELDNLLKHAMQFDSGEMPEPDSGIQKKLRRKVKTPASVKNRLATSLAHLLGLDSKLYYFGLAISAVAIVFIVLRNTGDEPKHTQNNIIIADTNSGSDTNIGANPRYDTFQTKKSTIQIY